MKTKTLLAVVATWAICATLAGVELAQTQQLDTGSDAVGRGGTALGAGVATDVASPESQWAVAPAAVGECVTNRTAFRTQTNQVSTTSTAEILMPNTHFPITTSGGCLIVDFSGMVAAGSTSTSMIIRAWIPGIGAAEPGSVILGLPVATASWETRSMRFVFPNVPAGTHTVRIEFRSTEGIIVYAANRTLTVQYRP